MKYSTRNTIHSTFGVLQSSLNHKVVFCLPTLLFKKTFANKNVLDVVAKPMFTFSKHVFLRVTGRLWNSEYRETQGTTCSCSCAITPREIHVYDSHSSRKHVPSLQIQDTKIRNIIIPDICCSRKDVDLLIIKFPSCNILFVEHFEIYFPPEA